MAINRKLRGIRDPVDPGYILGRPKNMGRGPAVQLKAPTGLLAPNQTLDVQAGLPASGVTAGNYTIASITVNSKGLITAASSGNATLPTLNDGQIWIGNGTNVAVARTPSGDVTVSDTGVTAIGANKVLTVMIADGNVTEAKIGLTDNTTNNSATGQHGFLKKLDGNATHYMDGSGNWSVPAGNGTTGAVVNAYSHTTSGNETSVTTSTISGGKHILLVVHGRVSTSASTVALQLQFNTDGGNNYAAEEAVANGSAFSFGTTTSTSSIRIGDLVGGTGTANFAGQVTAFIGNYLGTTFNKPVMSQSGYAATIAASPNAALNGGAWNSTAAIANLTVFPATDHFVNGTTIDVYTYN